MLPKCNLVPHRFHLEKCSQMSPYGEIHNRTHNFTNFAFGRFGALRLSI